MGTLVHRQADSRWYIVVSRDGDAQLPVQPEVEPHEGQAPVEVEVHKAGACHSFDGPASPPEYTRKIKEDHLFRLLV